MAISTKSLGDIAARFNITDAQAERIAAVVDTEEEFIAVWESADWWVGWRAREDREIITKITAIVDGKPRRSRFWAASGSLMVESEDGNEK